MFDPAPINTFADRVRSAAQARSKDMRLTMAEATELVAAITQLQAMALGRSRPSPLETVVSFDGGGMRKR